MKRATVSPRCRGDASSTREMWIASHAFQS